MTGYDPLAYQASERHNKNEESRNKADLHGEPWTQFEDEFIAEFWIAFDASPADRDEAGVAEALGRTIEACRVRAHQVRHGSARTTTRTTTRKVGNVTVTETTTVERKRPAWMDEEGLPDYYV